MHPPIYCNKFKFVTRRWTGKEFPVCKRQNFVCQWMSAFGDRLPGNNFPDLSLPVPVPFSFSSDFFCVFRVDILNYYVEFWSCCPQRATNRPVDHWTICQEVNWKGPPTTNKHLNGSLYVLFHKLPPTQVCQLFFVLSFPSSAPPLLNHRIHLRVSKDTLLAGEKCYCPHFRPDDKE